MAFIHLVQQCYPLTGFINLDATPIDASLQSNAQKASLLIEVLEDSFTSGIEKLIRYGQKTDGTWVGSFLAGAEQYGFTVSPQGQIITALISQPKLDSWFDAASVKPAVSTKSGRKAPKCQKTTSFRCGASCQPKINPSGKPRRCKHNASPEAQQKLEKLNQIASSSNTQISQKQANKSDKQNCIDILSSTTTSAKDKYNAMQSLKKGGMQNEEIKVYLKKGVTPEGFKELAQYKKEKEAAIKYEADYKKGIELARSQDKIIGSGKGHDLVNTKPLDEFSVSSGEEGIFDAYRSQAMSELLDIKDVKEAESIVKSIYSYTGESYTQIRQVESGSKKASKAQKEKYKADIDNINRYLRDAPKFEGEIQRGLNFNTPNQRQKFIDRLTRTGSMSLDAMSSWSSSSSVATHFAGKESGVILQVQNKSGASVRDFSNFAEEMEVIVPKGIKYQIKGISTDKTGAIVIKLEEF